MDFEWVAIGATDVLAIALAFLLGLLARMASLPPLVGFLACGFLLSGQGTADVELLQKLSDLGITLLLFTVGLKLNLRTLARPQVWAVASAHMLIVTCLLSAGLMLLGVLGFTLLSQAALTQALLVGFALSFSSTVFVVKVLEDRGEATSLHGRIAIGILLMQDIAAVIFLALSSGEAPSVWALLLLGLVPARFLLQRILQHAGHGELQVLYGFALALGGAELFEVCGLKGDLGALILGVCVAGHPKAEELAKAMLGFKDLFLLGFFLSIGLAGLPSSDAIMLALVLTPFLCLKGSLYFLLLTRLKLRARTSLLASMNLTNYSEFGLIVIAMSAANGWIGQDWLVGVSLALAVSFLLAAALSTRSDALYMRFWQHLRNYQRADLIADDQLLDLAGARIAIIGMGGVGTGAYDTLLGDNNKPIIGVDIDPVTARRQREAGRNVICGDPSDRDFWDRVDQAHTLELILLALPQQNIRLAVLDQLGRAGFAGRIAAIARFADEVHALEAAGATTVYNMYAEAGAGFVAHVTDALPGDLGHLAPIGGERPPQG